MVLYEDSEIVVCHKPAGVPVQSASVRVKDMVSILKNQTGGEIYVVHRLDQPVEGVLVFAKAKKAAADLSRQVSDGSMKKIYHAVVELSESALPGDVGQEKDSSLEKNQEQRPGEWHTLVDDLVKDARENRSFVVDDVGSKSGTSNEKVMADREPSSSKKMTYESDAKHAELRYRILKWWPEKESGTGRYETSIRAENPESGCSSPGKQIRALVEIDLKTGRHHQIRVQMAHAGMPLVGDRKYNKNFMNPYKESNSEMKSSEKVENLALCAVSLTFRHPATKKKMTYEIQPQFSDLTE